MAYKLKGAIKAPFFYGKQYYIIRRIKMSLHDEIMSQFDSYINESAKFEEKGVKASAARARKALGELGKLTKSRRKEIQEKKSTM